MFCNSHVATFKASACYFRLRQVRNNLSNFVESLVPAIELPYTSKDAGT